MMARLVSLSAAAWTQKPEKRNILCALIHGHARVCYTTSLQLMYFHSNILHVYSTGKGKRLFEVHATATSKKTALKGTSNIVFAGLHQPASPCITFLLTTNKQTNHPNHISSLSKCLSILCLINMRKQTVQCSLSAVMSSDLLSHILENDFSSVWSLIFVHVIQIFHFHWARKPTF